MPTFLIRSLPALLLLLALPACGDPKPDGDTDGAGTTGASDPGTTGDLSASATGPATTGTGTTATATTDATTGDATTDATAATTTATTDATTGGLVCDLVLLTCEIAEVNGMYEDCGTVDPWNHTAEQWQVARDCALAAVAEQRAFKLITWLQGIDSDVGVGYTAIVGESYSVHTIFYDSFEPASALLRSCATLSATPDCTVAPGEACLDCDDASDGEQLCD